MFWSKTFIPTLKEEPQEAESASHKLLLRAGCIRMLMAGVYSYLPLGLRVLDNIESIIRRQMNACGASELLLPALQPLELWKQSGRDKLLSDIMFKFVDRKGRNLCLGPTHEEVITELVKSYISSYRQLPLVLYQIQTKFRDEIRPRFGLVRSCEFIMKDAYSFDKDEAGLAGNYALMHDVYKRIFKRCGLEILTTEADPGMMGGSVSHEFMVPAASGEDMVTACPACKFAKTGEIAGKQACPKCKTEMQKINTIEVGHIFKLGTKYSASMRANFIDAKGRQQPLIMGCYGIGVSRLIPAIIEQNHDKAGIIWPAQVSPYQVIILALDITQKKIMDLALKIYAQLKDAGINVLFDDRDERAGVKFKDADLVGIPLQIVLGKEAMQDNNVELKIRAQAKRRIKKETEVLAEIKGLLKELK